MGAGGDNLDPALFDKQITDFSIDSRSVGGGEIFFALSQEDYARAGFNGTFADGHRFISDAFARGAVAAVGRVERVREDQQLMAVADRLLLVNDAIAALQTLARRVYESWSKPVVGITGSAGKTTAKELTALVLGSNGFRVLKSERNYNNGLGLPLSVLRMVSGDRTPDQFDVAVLEMGMSSPTHEIQRLCTITPPDVGVELMVAPVHLEFLGSIENIAAAKAELVEGLKPGGTAVLNADDELVMRMRNKHNGIVVTFGIDNRADVMALGIRNEELGFIGFQLKTPQGEAAAELHMSGRHNLMNALAAAAVGHCFDLSPGQIARALQTARAPKMRGEVWDFAAGFTVIDDSYNSNPRSLLNMVQTLAAARKTGQRLIVIAGEMLELGPEAAALHKEVGSEIGRTGIDTLWGVRGLAKDLITGANEVGLRSTRYFETAQDAAEAIAIEVREKDLILVKGSRGVATDHIVATLRQRYPLLGVDQKE
jgi:UDP-N-acetylmuramoyl-tripeptide--D-alanyl-D-alanine ligase